MWMEALLLTPYLVLASSGLLVAAVVAICWTQPFPRRPDDAVPAPSDRRAIRDRTRSQSRGFASLRPVTGAREPLIAVTPRA